MPGTSTLANSKLAGTKAKPPEEESQLLPDVECQY